MTMKFNPHAQGDAYGNIAADVTIDGKTVDVNHWPVYGGPYVTCNKGVLTVNDGQHGFVVDFSGDMPVYKPWKK